MLVNVCCSPSSGSTFFAHVLDRHPQIACGHELKIFSNALPLDDYTAFRRRRLWFRLFGLCGRPYNEYRSVVERLGSYRLGRGAFWRWVTECGSFPELIERLHAHIREVGGRPVWVEKTPRNIRVIGKFLSAFPAARVIHIVRDPRDMALSMTNKIGKASLVRAMAGWLSSVAAIQPHRADPRVLEFRYEDLCAEPEKTLRRVCGFLGLEFSMDWFRPDSGTASALGKNDGSIRWSSRPGEAFSTKSVCKHRAAGVDWGFAAGERLTAEYAALLGTRQWTVPELAAVYGYDFAAPAAPAGPYTPVHRSRLKNTLLRWVDSLLGIPPYMLHVEYAGPASGATAT